MHLIPPVPHRWHGVSWRGLPRYLWASHHEQRFREPCGCLIANVALYGHCCAPAPAREHFHIQID